MIKRYLVRIPEGLKQSLVTIVGNIATTGMSAVSLILISRLLGPDKFGEFSIGFSLVLILAKINDFGLGTTVLKFAGETTDSKKRSSVYSITLSYKLAASIVLMIVGVLFSPLIADVINFDRVDIILVSFFLSAATVYYEQMLVMLQSLHLFGKAVVANGIQAGSKLIGAVIFWFTNVQSSLLLFSWYALSPGFVWIFIRYFLPKSVKLKLALAYDSTARQVFGMAKHTSVSLIAGGIIENVDVFFVQRYLNTYETGLLSGVNRIALLFALVAYSLANVLNPRVSRYKTKRDLSKYLVKSLLVVLASAALFLTFIPFSKLSILLTIGPQYMDGGEILLILVAAQCLAIASIPFIALFYSFRSNWYFSVSGILQLLVVLVGNAVFVPMFGIAGAAWIRFGARLTLLVFTALLGYYMYRREYVQSR